jgi:hypothetical protein
MEVPPLALYPPLRAIRDEPTNFTSAPRNDSSAAINCNRLFFQSHRLYKRRYRSTAEEGSCFVGVLEALLGSERTSWHFKNNRAVLIRLTK